MSAAEIIELIKKLPPEELAIVWAYFELCDESGDDSPMAEQAAARGRVAFNQHPDQFRELARKFAA